MSGIRFLNSADLVLRTGERGNMLCLGQGNNEYPGLTLVLFYSTDCPYCGPLMSKFKQLPSRVTGCTFAMFNVSLNMDVVENSKNTISPIRYVPDLVLYVNGSPFMRYDGLHEVHAIQNFLQDIYDKLQRKTSFVQRELDTVRQADESYDHHFSSPSPAHQSSYATNSTAFSGNRDSGAQDASAGSTATMIPEYTIGKPVVGTADNDKCYFTFQKAYGSSSASVDPV